MNDLIAFLNARLDEDERAARAASGNTVIGEQGNWAPSPDGDEWEAHRSDDVDELLVALRPQLPRPADVMGGMWGAIVSDDPAFSQEPGADRPLPCLEHAARHDPARVLREVKAKRGILARVQNHAALMGWDEMHRDVLRLLVLPYADHPDRRPEWRP
ncbi:DUF6221 family protein [Streptomyces pini]|uniref:Uncharacterized protein n=1 Tax=Streptomyces pini TaxID=1520580 RepID=A0A1I4C003_9ACTN|nr:DUF6221 family protein [Streptomyces pini]SFK73679.1 hypothetical protein SAMN05192584_108184 [Streptomyces pini]